MVEKGLIRKTDSDVGSMTYTITTEGFEILNHEGGWRKYLQAELLGHIEERVEVSKEKQTEKNRFVITTFATNNRVRRNASFIVSVI
jgi:hypothetical protein